MLDSSSWHTFGSALKEDPWNHNLHEHILLAESCLAVMLAVCVHEVLQGSAEGVAQPFTPCTVLSVYSVDVLETTFCFTTFQSLPHSPVVMYMMSHNMFQRWWVISPVCR